VPETTPGEDAANLTALLCDYGGLWEITKTPNGYTAQRRPPPAPPAVFTVETVGALRALLEHGYDTAKLGGVLRDFGSKWEIERLDPGSAWVAVSRDGGFTQVIAAGDLDTLRSTLGMTSTDHTSAR
jgi:hypothetical protein